MNNNFSKEEILKAFSCGIEFEFYSNVEIEKIAKLLQKEIGKKIRIPYEIIGFNKTKIPTKPKESPTDEIFNLVRDYSGGKSMLELVTGPLPYAEARIIIIKVLKFIQEYGYTTKKAGLHLNISYKNIKLGSKNTILTMNPLKLCLIYDEEFIYKRFPKRRDNVYAKSIKQIYPANKFYINNNLQNINGAEFLCPNTKYYSLNFIKTAKNYLEIRALGGEDYEKKANKILEILEYSCLKIHEAVEHPEFTENDRSMLSSIIKNHKKIVNSFSDFNQFVINFPKIKLSVDLDGKAEVIQTFYMSFLRERLYDLIVKGKMKEGFINYDRDTGKVQVRDAILKQCDDLENFQIINCHTGGIFYNCEFYNSTIEDSQFNHCKIINTNIVKRCKINQTTIGMSNEIEESYIDSKDMNIAGQLKKCIIRAGNISHLAILTDTIKVSDD